MTNPVLGLRAPGTSGAPRPKAWTGQAAPRLRQGTEVLCFSVSEWNELPRNQASSPCHLYSQRNYTTTVSPRTNSV